MDQITLCLVATQEVDLQETGAFLEKFLGCIQSELLSKNNNVSSNSSDDLEAAARPLQASNAEQKFAYLSKDIGNFIDNWNDDPSNRSKVAVLFKELEKTKDVMIEDLSLSLERGQKVDQSLEKADALVRTSNTYVKTSKKVERSFWARKWMTVLIAIVIVLILCLFIYLFFKI